MALVLLLIAVESNAQPAAVEQWTVGKPVYGTGRFIEYIPGDLPIVISVPHGGELTPDVLPDRTRGVFYTDGGTQELARLVAEEFRKKTGKQPHVIINRLKRKKLDANREPDEAAQNNDMAEQAWHEYHAFIDTARQRIHREFGGGLYIDLHGHANAKQRIELGYALTSEDLDNTDNTLSEFPYPDVSTLANLVKRVKLPFASLIRDSISFGSMLERRGVAATPSREDLKPNDERFYSGGYSVRRHTADDGLEFFGFQIETPVEMRKHHAEREMLAPALVEAIRDFVIKFGNNETKQPFGGARLTY